MCSKCVLYHRQLNIFILKLQIFPQSTCFSNVFFRSESLFNLLKAHILLIFNPLRSTLDERLLSCGGKLLFVIHQVCAPISSHRRNQTDGRRDNGWQNRCFKQWKASYAWFGKSILSLQARFFSFHPEMENFWNLERWFSSVMNHISKPNSLTRIYLLLLQGT